ncbi:MAG: endonuclease/exonuclease/phosphatase family protein [Rhizobiaceae bacterium]
MLVKLAAFGIIGLLAASWLQELHPAFDTPSHFRLHFSAALLVLALLLLFVGAWRWTLIAIATIAVTLFLTQPYLPTLNSFNAQTAAPMADSQRATGPDELSVLQLNIRFNNQQVERTTKLVLQVQPDFVLLQEITRNNEAVLSQLLAAYPHQWHCHRRGIGSVAVLSRYPFAQHQDSTCLETRGFAQAKVQVGERILTLASFHSRWPFPRSQPRQMRALQADFEGLDHPLVLAGDFNSAPWSAAVQRAARWTRTKPAEGMVMTWGSRFSVIRDLIGPSLPIDQIMISPELSFQQRIVLEDIGSDHYPILTRLKFR